MSLQIPGRLHFFSPHTLPDLLNLISTLIYTDCDDDGWPLKPPEEKMFGGILFPDLPNLVSILIFIDTGYMIHETFVTIETWYH